VGQTLTAGLGTLADVDGLGTLSYSWAIAGTNVSNTNSYSITSNDIGKTLTLTGRYTDMQGTLETTNTSVIISKSPAVSLNALDGLMTAENNGIDNSVSLAKAIHIAVKLDTQPLRDVTVNFVSSDISEGIITNASLTFTSLNWNTAQTLTISGVNDNENDGNIPYQITASISSDDVNYRQLSINPINLVNNDDGRDTALTLSGDANGVPKNDVLIGMDGADKLYGLLLADDLSGGLGNDTIYGGYDDDFLYGSEGNDYLWGEQDNDKLMGENGNDTLDGGTGLDTLMGGAGNDTYYLGYDAVDVITDNGLTTDIDTVIMPYLMSSYSKVKLS
jgi:Ca2+-binding RTX toxin-like protein